MAKATQTPALSDVIDAAMAESRPVERSEPSEPSPTPPATTEPATPFARLIADKPERGQIDVTDGKLAPRDFEGVKRMASMALAAGIVPSGLNSLEKVTTAIAFGMEIGLTPMKALKSVLIVRGMPAIWGDALPELVLRSGKAEYIKEGWDGEGDKLSAWCEVKRHDMSEPVRRQFSVADARAAKLWQKDTYQQYPRRMLQIRARAWAFRDAFADVLGGYGVVEELQDVNAAAEMGEAADLTAKLTGP